jgi:DNA-directed RNA polymerase subunit K/omega
VSAIYGIRSEFVIAKRESGNKFEFVVVAGARARQLMAGAVPRTQGAGKPVRLAQREVKEGKVEKIETDGSSA